MCISTLTSNCDISSYPIFTTPTKETNCSLNLTILNVNNITPRNYITLKQVIFNIEKEKYESSDDSLMTQYLKPNYNKKHVVHQTNNFNIKIMPLTSFPKII